MAKRGSPAFVVAPSVLYRKEMIDKEAFRYTSGTLDLYAWFDADSRNFDMCGIDAPIMFHRAHDQAVSTKLTPDQWLDGFMPLYKFVIAHEQSDNVVEFVRYSAARVAISAAAHRGGLASIMRLSKRIKRDFDYQVPLAVKARAVISGVIGALFGDKLRAKIAAIVARLGRS